LEDYEKSVDGMSDVKERRIRILRVQGKKYSSAQAWLGSSTRARSRFGCMEFFLATYPIRTILFGKIIRGLVERGELPSDTVLEKVGHNDNFLINGQIDIRIRSQKFLPVQPLDKISAIVKEIPADPDDPVDKRITPEQAFEALKILNPDIISVRPPDWQLQDNFWKDSDGDEYRFRCHAGIAWPEGVTQWPMPAKTWRTATVDDVVPAEPKKVRFKRIGFGWSDGHLIGIVSGQYFVITVSETPMLAHECEVAE